MAHIFCPKHENKDKTRKFDVPLDAFRFNMAFQNSTLWFNNNSFTTFESTAV